MSELDSIQHARALPTRQDVQLFQANFDAALNYYTPQIADALPDDIQFQFFKRVFITAINNNPDLYHADRPSLFNALIKCAQDGLLPDGREAALVVFNTEVKRKDAEGIERSAWVPIVQYMPMIFGIRKRMRNSGEVLSAIAEIVYRNDKFRHVKGEEERIEHEPCALGDEPGDPIGAYAIIKLTNGEILRDVMSFKEIENSRAKSKAKNSLMWTSFWSEGAKKTVLRRCSKGAPQDSRMRRTLDRDDEPLGLPKESHVALPPPRPTRETAEQRMAEVAELKEEEDRPAASHTYDITDCDGETWETPIEEVESFLTEIFAEAQRRGPKAVEAAIENNVSVAANLWRVFSEARASLASPAPEKPKRHRATKAEMESRRAAAAAAQQKDPPSSPGDGGAPPERPLVPPAANLPASPSPVPAQPSGGAPHPTRAEVEDPVPKRSQTAEPGSSSETEARPSSAGGSGPPAAPTRRDSGIAGSLHSEAGGSPALPYEVDMPMGVDLRTWALALLPDRLRKCKTKAEAAIVLDVNDRHIRRYTAGMSDKHYQAYQADYLDRSTEGLP